MPQYSLKTLQSTVFKQQPISSSEISDPTQKEDIPVNKELLVHSYNYDLGTKHYKIAFLTESFQGKNTWFVYAGHVEICRDGVVLSPDQPIEKKLNVKWRSQLDNMHDPHGSCNATSVAMCLSYLGHPEPSNQQLEDEIYQYLTDNNLHPGLPENMAAVIQRYGYKDNLQRNGNWDDLKPWLNAGNPIIVHGYFTHTGHIVAVIGYNSKGWIVNDPYAEWNESGYDTNASGAGLTYSYGMMERICHRSGDLWIHYVYK